jgi:hypothetical protein
MEKEFIEYEQALALKELGFDEPCNTCYDKLEMTASYGENVFDYKNYNTSGYVVSRPTFSQAFRWFRDKYNLRGFIGFRPNVKQFDCHIYDMSLSGKEYVKQRTMEEFNKDPKVGTYEESELECLKKLIEIVKKQKEDESNIIV